jgi:hypothetical protein
MKPSVPMRFSRIRNLAANQGDRKAKLQEIIEIATDMLKEFKAPPKARREKTGRDRSETGGRDRGE